ncbi:MAG: hypothetical protein Q9225_008106 [Loekoesia sp. 1 TL-2023]
MCSLKSIPPAPETPPSEAPPASSTLEPFSAPDDITTGTGSGSSKTGPASASRTTSGTHGTSTGSNNVTSSAAAACSMKSIPPALETPPPEAPPASTTLTPFSADGEDSPTSGGSPSSTKKSDDQHPSSTKKDEPSSTKAPEPHTTSKPSPEPSTKKEDPQPKPTPEPEPKVDPVNPPSAPKCNDSPTGHYQDAHAEVASEAVSAFCANYANKVVHDPKVDIKATGHDDPLLQFLDDNDSNDDVYDLSIKSVEHCDPGDGGYNLAEPVKGHSCEEVMYNSWSQCEFSFSLALLRFSHDVA